MSPAGTWKLLAARRDPSDDSGQACVADPEGVRHLVDYELVDDRRGCAGHEAANWKIASVDGADSEAEHFVRCYVDADDLADSDGEDPWDVLFSMAPD